MLWENPYRRRVAQHQGSQRMWPLAAHSRRLRVVQSYSQTRRHRLVLVVSGPVDLLKTQEIEPPAPLRRPKGTPAEIGSDFSASRWPEDLGRLARRRGNAREGSRRLARTADRRPHQSTPLVNGRATSLAVQRGRCLCASLSNGHGGSDSRCPCSAGADCIRNSSAVASNATERIRTASAFRPQFVRTGTGHDADW